jgi:hypothetical protein
MMILIIYKPDTCLFPPKMSSLVAKAAKAPLEEHIFMFNCRECRGIRPISEKSGLDKTCNRCARGLHAEESGIFYPDELDGDERPIYNEFYDENPNFHKECAYCHFPLVTKNADHMEEGDALYDEDYMADEAEADAKSDDDSEAFVGTTEPYITCESCNAHFHQSCMLGWWKGCNDQCPNCYEDFPAPARNYESDQDITNEEDSY